MGAGDNDAAEVGVEGGDATVVSDGVGDGAEVDVGGTDGGVVGDGSSADGTVSGSVGAEEISGIGIGTVRGSVPCSI